MDSNPKPTVHGSRSAWQDPKARRETVQAGTLKLLRVGSVWLLIAAALLTGCASGLYDTDRSYTQSVDPPSDTKLATAVAAWQQRSGTASGFVPLIDGLEALGTRLELIALAESTIDAQYFILKSDASGYLFTSALAAAGRRGVRIRLLIDDLSTPVDDASLLLLDSMDNIEVRLFNPIGRGGFYWGNFVRYFERANRRMHNKTFIVDNSAGVIGGRNIGNEYFALRNKDEFLDLDLLVAGNAAKPTSETFDTFWNHPLSVPMAAYAERVSDKKQSAARKRAELGAIDAAEQHRDRVIAAGIIDEILEGKLPLYPGTARAITDDPDKLLTEPSGEFQVVINEVTRAMRQARREILIVTPYLIPGDSGVAFLGELVDKGIRVAILTNSLASNNHIPVHSAYQRYRPRLLEAGVELYEVRASASVYYQDLGPIDSRANDRLTMHTKGVIIDRQLVYAGSLNIDPRAIELNTEFGLLIESPELGETFASLFDNRVNGPSIYGVELTDGRLQWRASEDGEDRILTREPDAGFWRRFLAQISKILPEKQF